MHVQGEQSTRHENTAYAMSGDSVVNGDLVKVLREVLAEQVLVATKCGASVAGVKQR